MLAALNCQKETAEVVIKEKGDCLLDVKGNQATLEQEIKEYVAEKTLRGEMDNSSQTEKTGAVLKRKEWQTEEWHYSLSPVIR